MKDLSAPYTPQEKLAGKMCLNGASVDGFQGDIIEYWANLECPYCDIKEPLAAQRDNPNLCIVVRHSPSASYGESVKKSLVYETLMQLSPNAAHQFWSDILPEKGKGVPVPYEAALQKEPEISEGWRISVEKIPLGNTLQEQEITVQY
ncbi:MAG: hypothetical protein IIV56_00435, partial [Mailhella sp.]|nr:hypothetical protein [Mailhella sp.]